MSPIKLDVSQTMKYPIKIVRHLFLNIYIYIIYDCSYRHIPNTSNLRIISIQTIYKILNHVVATSLVIELYYVDKR